MKSVFSLAILSVLAISLGCATDPNKQVTDANAAHAADVADTKEETANMEASQAKDHAAVDSEHEKEDASMEKQTVDDASKFNKEREAAMANVVEARRKFRADADGRLDKVNAKATLLESKRASKKIAEPTLATLRTTYASVKTLVVNLDSATDANWFNSMKAVETNLVALEKDVSDIEGRM